MGSNRRKRQKTEQCGWHQFPTFLDLEYARCIFRNWRMQRHMELALERETSRRRRIKWQTTGRSTQARLHNHILPIELSPTRQFQWPRSLHTAFPPRTYHRSQACCPLCGQSTRSADEAPPARNYQVIIKLTEESDFIALFKSLSVWSWL